MKTFRLAFLLGILSTSLVGCGGGNSTCKVTFKGTNCSIRNGLDDKAKEFTTLDVPKGSSQTFQIFVSDPAKYLIPDSDGVTVTDGVTKYYYPNGKDGGAKGELDLPKIDRDITITAIAREKAEVTYSVEYPYDPNTTWEGPSEIVAGEELSATVSVTEPYILKKDYLYVTINHTVYLNFTLKDNKFTIPAAAITGNVVIRGMALRPTKNYEVKLEVKNTNKSTPFPETMEENSSLYAVFTAKDGYRLPKIIDGIPKHDEFSVHTKGESGLDVALTPFDYQTLSGDFIYEIVTEDGVEYATVYIIPGAVSGSLINSIVFEGAAVEQVSVTFQVGKESSYWPGGGTEDKIGTADVNSQLYEIAEKCGANNTPIVDDPSLEFAGWFDADGQQVNTTDEITENIVVHAEFIQKVFNFVTDAKKVIIPELPNVHYHDPLGSENNPIVFTADDTDGGDYKLPVKKFVSVKMRSAGGTGPYDKDIEFNYFPNTENYKTANFWIDSGIIEGDVKIEITANQYVTVSFNPGEGTWPKAGVTGVQTASVIAGTTLGDALNTLNTGGNPTKSGQTWSGWFSGGTLYLPETKITPDISPLEVTAKFNETITFQNDAWANVIAHVEDGTFKEVYKSTYYLGAERTLEYQKPIGNEKVYYKVRVIDEGYDSYVKVVDKEEKTFLSGLTFEFVDLIGEGEYGHYVDEEKPWDPNQPSNNWEGSTYRSRLDTFYNAIVRFNPGFAAKKALKYTLQGRLESGNGTPKDMVTTKDYLFPLSGAEINIADANLIASATTYQQDQRTNESAQQLGIPYSYYLVNPSRSKKLNGAGSNSNYWLRSPHVNFEEWQSHSGDFDQANCYYMKTGGLATDFEGAQSAHAVTPYGYMAAFCI